MGFHLFRSVDGAPLWRITESLIPGFGQPASYEYQDLDVEHGVVYGYALESVERDGSSQFFDFSNTTAELVPPADSTLAVIFINPVEPPTSFGVFFPRPDLARLTVYDVAGRMRASIDLEVPRAGDYRYRWNGDDEDGEPLQSGIFFARLVAGGQSVVRKVVLLRR